MSTKKKSILFLCPYPLGQAPSQRFRFEQYFRLLEAANYSVDVQSFLTLQAWSILYKPGNEFRKLVATLSGFTRRCWTLLMHAPRFDYIFIHREATPVGPPLVEWALASLFKKKIIYDFDDAIWIPSTSHENKIASWIKMTGKVQSICRWSYKVSCGNEYLCDYARQFNSNVVLNPTTIDTEFLHNPNLFPPRTDDGTVTVGWTGTHSTLKYLDPIAPVISNLKRTFIEHLRFVVFADKKPDLGIDSLIFVPWSKEREIADLMTLEVGLMPLTDDPWAKGKCGFKALQYMALGIPALASPVGVNTKIIDHGINGYLCNTLEEWQAYLESLIKDKGLRKQLGENGRKKILAQFSVESNASNFLSLFS